MCEHFIAAPDETGPKNACELVRGIVNRYDTCDLFERAAPAAATESDRDDDDADDDDDDDDIEDADDEEEPTMPKELRMPAMPRGDVREWSEEDKEGVLVALQNLAATVAAQIRALRHELGERGEEREAAPGPGSIGAGMPWEPVTVGTVSMDRRRPKGPAVEAFRRGYDGPSRVPSARGRSAAAFFREAYARGDR